MTRLADRIVGRIADMVSFGLLYRDGAFIQFMRLPKDSKWKIISNTRWTRVETVVDHLYTDCKVRVLTGPGFNVNLEDGGVEIIGYWDGDTEDEKEEACGLDEEEEDERWPRSMRS